MPGAHVGAQGGAVMGSGNGLGQTLSLVPSDAPPPLWYARVQEQRACRGRWSHILLGTRLHGTQRMHIQMAEGAHAHHLAPYPGQSKRCTWPDTRSWLCLRALDGDINLGPWGRGEAISGIPRARRASKGGVARYDDPDRGAECLSLSGCLHFHFSFIPKDHLWVSGWKCKCPRGMPGF